MEHAGSKVPVETFSHRSVLLISADRTSPAGYAYSLGDAMLTDALAQAIRQTGSEVIVADFGEAVRSDGSRRLLGGLADLLRAARKADQIVVGGGTLFQDDVPERAFGGLPRLCLACGLVGYLSGRRVTFFGVGVDPISRWRQRICIRVAARLAEGVVVRDTASLERLHLMAGKSAELGGDTATLLASGRGETVPMALRKGAVLALNGLEAKLTAPAIADSLATSYGPVSFVSMHQGSSPDAIHLPEETRARLNVIEGNMQWVDAVSLVRTSRVAVASRLHALYLAALTETPAVAIGNSPKVTSFARDFGVPHIAVGDLVTNSFKPEIPSQEELFRVQERVRTLMRRYGLVS
jgi:polysaccharide pyruvyl transferase WcaK-like protein